MSAQESIIDPKKIQLDNGTRIIAGHIPESPLTTVQIRVLSGLSNEGTYAGAGISHFLEHLLFKGTPERTSEELRKRIKLMGGVVNGSTGLDSAEYHITVPNEELEEAIGLITDIVMFPVFSDEEMEREREVILREIRLLEDDPMSRRISLLFSETYSTHVYRHRIIGEADKVRGLTHKDITDYHAQAYTPERIVVGIVGGVPEKESLRLASEKLGGFKRGKGYVPEIEPETPHAEAVFSKFDADVSLGYMAIGFMTTSLYSKDLYPVDVLSILFGTGEGSRLYKRLVKEKELLYEVSSFNYTPKYPGSFVITGTGEPEKLEEARTEIFRMIEEMKSGGVSDSEVSRAKNLVISDYLYSHEMAEEIVSSMTTSEMLMGDPLFFQEYVEGINKVTAEEVKGILPEYFTEDNSTTVFLLPAEPSVRPNEELTLKGGPGERGAGAKRDSPEEKKEQPVSAEKKTSDKSGKIEEKDYTERIAVGAKKSEDKIPSVKHEPIITSSEENEDEQVSEALTLDNGLTIVVKRRPRLPLVSVTFAAHGGLREETEHSNGVSNLTSALLLKGTSNRTENDIVSNIEEYGGSISAFSGMNSIGVSMDLLSSRMESGFDILEDILKNSIFPEDELIRIKKKIVASIKEEDKDIFDRGMNALRVLLYGKNPYSMRISGEIGTVGNMSRERVMSFYQGQVIPEGSVITVVGDVDIEGVVTDLKERFSGWDREKEAAPVNDLEPIREEKRIDLDMEKEQALFMCGFQGVKMDDEKKYPLSIISALLSGSDGLLFFSAREEMGIAYASGALNVPAVDPGYFLLYLATTEEDLSSAEEAVFKALAKVRRGEIEDDDITASKNRLITQSALSLETNSAVSLRMALDELYGLGYEDYKRYPEKIRNVSKKDIENVSGEILMTARSAVVLVHSTRAER